jgi:predicted transglutaminase-like cysteine proteinase
MMNALQKAQNALRRRLPERAFSPRAVTGRAPRSRLGGLAAGAFAAATMLSAAAGAGAVDLSGMAPPLFGAPGMPSTDLSPFTKWTHVLSAHDAERARMHQECAPGDSCKLQQWGVFIESLRGLDRWSQIVEVNRRMNSARYIEDIDNYGVTDYWATPGEFFDRSGDCEDYAIAKFMTLRQLGFSNEEMRIAIVHDTNLNLVHAVLVIYHEGVAYLLDNQIEQVVRVDSIRHYRPYYSVNETMWWRHS